MKDTENNCTDCFYYWQNNDTENECNGAEKPCHEFIAKRMSMTENETIKKHIEECEHRIGNILGFMVSNSDADTSICEENITVLKIAIQALEEIQQYRAIGTVEECKNSKVIADERYDYLMDDIGLLKRYASIGTIEEFKALKEKSVSKKPAPIDYEKYIDVVENAKFLRGAYWCPNCKHTVRSGAYCDDCGQKLDWQ